MVCTWRMVRKVVFREVTSATNLGPHAITEAGESRGAPRAPIAAPNDFVKWRLRCKRPFSALVPECLAGAWSLRKGSGNFSFVPRAIISLLCT